MKITGPGEELSRTSADADTPKAQNEPTTADSESQTSAPLIALPELPKGGGALAGMGDEFSVNTLTGTGGAWIPLPVSPGRSGVQPALGLAYQSSGGNGPFGMGWSASPDSISRRTDRGVPNYEHFGTDVFVSASLGELVRSTDRVGRIVVAEQGAGTFMIRVGAQQVSVTRGAETRTQFAAHVVAALGALSGVTSELDVSGHVVNISGTDRAVLSVAGEGRGLIAITYFRPRDEGGFARVERWQAADSDVHWQIVDGGNVRNVYGCTSEGRVSDASGQRIFRWNLERTVHPYGNAVEYVYKAEDDEGVSLSPFESPRLGEHQSQTYLKSARYSFTEAYYCDGATDPLTRPLPSTFHQELVFDFGEHDVSAVPEPDQPWTLRADAFSTCRAAFEIRTRRLCQRVLMFHHQLPLPSAAGGQLGTQLVRTLELAYDHSPHGAKLVSAHTLGYALGASGYTTKATPSVTFDYSPLMLGTQVQLVDEASTREIHSGLGSGSFAFADLDGEGVAGLLTRTDGALIYKRPLGNGGFAPSTVRSTAPWLLEGGQGAIADVGSDGSTALVSLRSGTAGFEERADDERSGWRPFREFRQFPIDSLDSADVRMVDVTGDGFTDAVVADGDELRWYRGYGRDGFGPPLAVFSPPSEDDGPRVVFSDTEQIVLFADMTGDGLSDMVRVRATSVSYWQSLGFGKFGPKRTMTNSPQFDSRGGFDPSRVRTSDVDGSGTADLMYIGESNATLFLNHSGNSWSDGDELPELPGLTADSTVQVADLLGTGTGCLVWSTSLPALQPTSLRFIDLCSSVKPHLLRETNNGRGLVRRVYYGSSTAHYLRDRDSETPWATKLPFPVHVIEKVETIDLISGGRLQSTYRYRHGHYDRHEREFRGFGLVEQTDVETFFAPSEVATAASSEVGHQQSDGVLVRTWHHLGADRAGKPVAENFGSEYWSPSVPNAPFLREFSDELPAETARLSDRAEALRSLKGRPIRAELFSIDSQGELSEAPYTVTHSTYRVRTIQLGSSEGQGSYLVTPAEAVTYNYEGDESDPRVTHALTLETNEFGHALRSASIAYGRAGVDASSDPLRAAQTVLYASVQETRAFYSVRGSSIGAGAYAVPGANDPAAWYRLAVPIDEREWEYLPGSVATGELLGLDAVRAETAPTATLDPDGVNRVKPRGVIGASARLRLRKHNYALYVADARPAEGYLDSQPLPLTDVESLALPFQSYALAFTPEVLTDAYGPTDGTSWVRESLPESEAAEFGYDVDAAGCWWIPSGRVVPKGATGYFLPEKAVDPFGNVSQVAYDQFDLLVTAAEQPPIMNARMAAPVVLTQQFEPSYRTLAPVASIDPNGNRSEVEVDALGMVVASALVGKLVGEADSLAAGEPSTRFAYQLALGADGTPPHAQVERRERHWKNGETTWASVDKLVSVAYFDGFGRDLATIARAGDFRTRLEPWVPDPEDPTPPAPAATAGTSTVWCHRVGGVVPGMRLTISDATNSETHAVTGVDPSTKLVQIDGTLAHTYSREDDSVSVVVERWAASGRTVYDHKERPVRQYEPYFTTAPLVEAFGSDFAQTPAFALREAETTLSAATPDADSPLTLAVASSAGFAPGQRVRIGDASSNAATVYEVEAVPSATALRLRSAPVAHASGVAVTALPGRGVAAELTYDALGRTVRTDFPDGTFTKTEWTPWEQEVYDACDTVADSSWYTKQLEGTPHQVAAAAASLAHADTPTVMMLDALARPYAVGTQSGPSTPIGLEDGLLYELSAFDSEGNVSRIQDRRSFLRALGADAARADDHAGSPDAPEAFDAFVHKYDLTGRELHSLGMDNGARWSLPDVSGAPALSWKGEDTPGAHWFLLRPAYDALRRPTALWETVNWSATSPPAPKCRALTIYGEEVSNPADSNYLGRKYAQYDSGGATIAQGYGLQGNPLSVTRSLARFIANRDDSTAGVLAADPDYAIPSAITTSISDLDASAGQQLESESFVSEMSYDALGRVVQSKAPASDPTARAIHTYGYGKSGALSCIDVNDRTGQTHQILKYVEHNARGQRTRLERGNGVSSTFSYDPHSFRVTSIRAKKESGPTLQELQYTYDAAGNVLRIEDAAQQTVYFANTVVEPVQTFVVDALYRLVEATGREHAPVFGLDPSVLPEPSLGLPSDDVLQTYTRSYQYDAAGNLLKLDVLGGWTRNITVAADSNRLVEVAHGDDPTTLIALGSDQFGNMSGVPNVDVMRWDRAGNLRYSQSAGGSNRRVWYQYGADKQRVRKVVEVRTNSSAEWRRERETLYLGGQEFYRAYDGSEAVDYERDSVHVMDGDRREAMLECVVLDGGTVPSPIVVTLRYVLSDHLRSAGVELDEGGEVISYETFHPYGTTAYYSVAVGSGYAAKRYRYSGKERDAETGLDYYGYRYLCAWLARWVSADPAGTVDGLNVFSFVSGRAASSADHMGLKTKQEASPFVRQRPSSPPSTADQSGMSPSADGGQPVAEVESAVSAAAALVDDAVRSAESLAESSPLPDLHIIVYADETGNSLLLARAIAGPDDTIVDFADLPRLKELNGTFETVYLHSHGDPGDVYTGGSVEVVGRDMYAPDFARFVRRNLAGVDAARMSFHGCRIARNMVFLESVAAELDLQSAEGSSDWYMFALTEPIDLGISPAELATLGPEEQQPYRDLLAGIIDASEGWPTHLLVNPTIETWMELDGVLIWAGIQDSRTYDPAKPIYSIDEPVVLPDENLTDTQGMRRHERD